MKCFLVKLNNSIYYSKLNLLPSFVVIKMGKKHILFNRFSKGSHSFVVYG